MLFLPNVGKIIIGVPIGNDVYSKENNQYTPGNKLN